MDTKILSVTSQIFVEKIIDFEAEAICEQVAKVFAQCSDYFILVDGLIACTNRAYKECQELRQKESPLVWLIYEQESSKQDRGQEIGVVFTAQREDDGAVADIFLYLIEEKKRRQKIGSAILAKIEKDLYSTGIEKIEVAVDENNEVALAFWLANGYSTTNIGKILNSRQANRRVVFLNKKL